MKKSKYVQNKAEKIRQIVGEKIRELAKHGLARIKAFFQVRITVYTLNYIFSLQLKKLCSKRLCEGIGKTLRKDDSCDSTLAI